MCAAYTHCVLVTQETTFKVWGAAYTGWHITHEDLWYATCIFVCHSPQIFSESHLYMDGFVHFPFVPFIHFSECYFLKGFYSQKLA